MEPLIEVEKLNCKYGMNYLLKNIDWKVYPGEHWVVFGMNGSGKTTLLSIIAGFQEKTGGKVRVFGQEYENDNILSLRKKIGWISASFYDKKYSSESVLDIVLSAKFGTLGKAGQIDLKDIRRATDLLTDLGLTRQIYYTFDMLSKGERQNVLIARALFSNPEILVLDEPCTGLDIYNREYLFQTIERLAQEKQITLIYVTHYVEEIRPLFDKCLLLRDGRIFAKGNMSELFNDSCLMDFLGYEIHIETDSYGEKHLSVPKVTSEIGRYLE